MRVPGALLQMGDVHATMGDAELCGTGIEIPAEITVRVQLVKDFELNCRCSRPSALTASGT